MWLKCVSYLWRSIPIVRSGQRPGFLYSTHGSRGIVLNCYRKESMMTRFNIWSQTSAAYTKPNPAKMAKMGVGLDLTALIDTRQAVE